MKRTERDIYIRIEAATYEAEISREYIDVLLSGERVARLAPASCVNANDGSEAKDAPQITDFSACEEGGCAVFTWCASSPVWEKEKFVLKCSDERMEYYIEVEGRGKVDGVEYFRGSHGSEYEFDTGFAPIPTVDGASQCRFSAQKEYDEFSFLTIPPMFTYVFDICGISDKLAFALVAERGEHNFTKFAYRTESHRGLRRFWFDTDQCAHTFVDGAWKTPSVMIYGAPSETEAMKHYSDVYFNTGRAEAKQDVKRPRFWYGPIACGWTEQAAYSDYHGLGISQPDMACRELYDNFTRELERHDLHPTLMIIDDKWQTAYGDPYADASKWEDLRAWIDAERAHHGIHTMLWYKLWDSEGLPDDECMESDGDWCRRCADPTNPKYRARLRNIMHRLLSPDEGCYNADGLKLDFAFFQPTGRSAVSHSGKYGVELFLEYIKTVYALAKEFKPDAVISASPCHPLFAPYVDHARLHDYHPDLRRSLEEFSFRRELYHIALPWSLIDTDGAGYRSHRDTMRYLLSSYRLGIPDLYCITDLFGLHISDDDWREVSKVWREYGAWADKICDIK